MDKDSYYVAPSDKIFNAVKAAAIELWQTYDNTYGYVTEKVTRVERITNFKDNCCYIVAMFDYWNQDRLFNILSANGEDDAALWLSDLLAYARKDIS